MKEVVIVRTGLANLASVIAGFERLDCALEVTEDAGRVENAARLVLPGVGSFGAAMRRLRELELVEPIRRRLAAERPTMGICLGLQMLCESSDESPEVEGLGWLNAHVSRFSGDVVVPQLGWNRVVPDDGCRFLEEGWAYYANSYRVPELEPVDELHVARTDHGGEFVAAVERGPILACQFHPELSGRWGLALMKRWLEEVD